MDAPTEVALDFTGKPAAWRYMLGALRHRRAWKPGEPFPRIVARWSGWRADPRDIATFARLAAAPVPGDDLPPLFLHAIAFRLQMAVLTHPAFAVPIWRVLQVRNQLVEALAVQRGALLDFETRIHAHRVTARGLEVDLHTRITREGELVGASLNTFYVRGRFGEPTPGDPAPNAGMPDSRGGHPVASWHMAAGGGLAFAALTGDYNGIHLSDRYARLFGFRRAFFHPLHVAAQALARAGLEGCVPVRRFDLWMRGPVFHGSDVELMLAPERRATVLALSSSQDTRPALVMRCSFP